MTSPLTPSGGLDLPLVVTSLMKGVVYRDDQEVTWRHLLALQSQVRDHIDVLGLVVVIDETEGYAFRKLSTLLRQFGGEFQVFVAFSSSGLLIHVVVGSCGGVGGLDTNRSGCDWKAASKVTARCWRTSSAVP